MFLLVNKFKMIEMIESCVLSGPKKLTNIYITKESNGFHNHSTMITIKQQYPRYITPLTVHKFLFQSYPIFSVTVYKTNKQTKDCAPSGNSRKNWQEKQKHQLKHLCFDSALMFAAFLKQSLRITMLLMLLNETKSLLLWAAILDHVWHQNYFFLLFSRLHDQTLYARQHEVAKWSNICSWCKILNENIWSRSNVESNSTQTYLCGDTQRQQRKAERRKRTSSLIFVLPMFPCVSSPVIHVSLAFRARLCAKNEASEEKATVKR